MEIELNDKTLYHVQANIDWHSDTYDLFILSEKEPTKEQIAKLYADENGRSIDDEQVKEFLEYANTYTVYAEEL